MVSPTYEGACSDVASASRACHAAGVPLVVDEAHGAHLAFLGAPGDGQSDPLQGTTNHRCPPVFSFVAAILYSALLVAAEAEAGAGTTQHRRYPFSIGLLLLPIGRIPLTPHATKRVGWAWQGARGAQARKTRLVRVLWARAKRDAKRNCDTRLNGAGKQEDESAGGRSWVSRTPPSRSFASIFTSAAPETLLAGTIQLTSTLLSLPTTPLTPITSTDVLFSPSDRAA